MSTIGVRADHDFEFSNGMKGALHAMAGWRHAWGDVTPTNTQYFRDGNAFSIAGAPIASNSALLEAGVSFNITPSAYLDFSWQGQFASGAQEQSLKANLGMRF